MSEREQIEAGLAALEVQRGVLGEAVFEMAAAPLRARLETLRAQSAAQQRKQVTVMFVDAVGSTAMSRALDPEDVHAVMDGALQRFTDVVGAHGGRVLQYTGDGLLAAFGADEAREDDPERAVMAGLKVLEAAQAHAAHVRATLGVDGFTVRVGLNTGPVLLGGGMDAEGSIRGDTVNIAARMEQTAPPGGLRIHHDTYRHVRGVFRVGEEPPLAVKGREQPVRSYIVHGLQPRAFRMATRGIEGVETRMVARQDELETLQDRVAALRGERGCTTVCVIGEAGLGKSRLLYELESWIDARAIDAVRLRGRADPQTRGRPFGLLHAVLAWRLQIADDDDATTARAKLVEGVAPLFETDGEAHAHLLGQLVGLDFSASPHVSAIADDARQLRNRGFHAAAEMLRRIGAAAGAPLIVLLDDLQWADEGSLDFIEYLEQVQREHPMLIVAAGRPLLYERRPSWDILDNARQRIDLQPLDRRGARELVGELLQKLDSVPAALREMLIAHADGNPFFMEEVVRMLIDDGAIVVGPDRWRLEPQKLLDAQVPPTLTGVLQARLDSLPPTEKLALQQAAVIGFVFWDQALAALDPAAPAALPALLRRGLLVAHEHTRFEGQAEYAFRHQALHQVTYESLLKRQRRECHAAAADWLGQQAAGRGDETLGLAAEHHERAGETDAAAELYTRAAEAAAARFALETMFSCVQKALALLPPDERALRWRLLCLRGRHMLERGETAAYAADLAAMERLAQAQDDDTWRARVALAESAAHRAAGDFAASEAACRRGLALATAPQAVPMALQLRHSLADTLIGLGRYDEARGLVDEGLVLARQHGQRRVEHILINSLGLIAMERGDLWTAVGHFEQGLQMARELGNPVDEGLRLNNLGAVYPMLGDYARARRCLEEGLQLARRTGQSSTEASLVLNSASVAHLQGDDTAALALAHGAHELAAASGQRDLQAFALMVRGHAELGLGRLAEARAAYEASRQQLESLKMRRQQVLDPVSGLARVALAEGRLDEARRHGEALLAHLDEGGSFDGTEEPLLLWLTCHRALAAVGHARAAEVLERAHAELQAVAARIGHAPAREAVLQAVPHHRELVTLWARRAAATA